MPRSSRTSTGIVSGKIEPDGRDGDGIATSLPGRYRWWTPEVRDRPVPPSEERRLRCPGHEPGLVRDHHELRPIAGSQLAQDPADVGLGGRATDEEPFGELVVRQTLRD